MRVARRTSRIAPDAPHGCPSAMAPPSPADRGLVEADGVADGEHLRGEGLGELDERRDRRRMPRRDRARGGSRVPARRRAVPGRMPRPTPRGRAARAVRARRARDSVVTAIAAAPSAIAAGVARRDRAVGSERRAEARERGGVESPSRPVSRSRRRRPARARRRTSRLPVRRPRARASARRRHPVARG